MEALCAVYLVNRFADGLQAFDRPGGLLKFALIALVSAMVSATHRPNKSCRVRLRALAELSAGLDDVVAGRYDRNPDGDTFARSLERSSETPMDAAGHHRSKFAFRAADFVGLVVFSGSFPGSAKNFPLTFLRGPIVIWMAFRFTPRETATGMLIYSAIAIWGTLHGNGPFLMDDENQSLLMLQVRTAVTAVTALALVGGDGGKAPRRSRDRAAARRWSKPPTRRRTIFWRCCRMNCERR